MQVVVSLCHFCELNGPSVVFTTQTRQVAAVDGRDDELLDQGYEVVDRKHSQGLEQRGVTSAMTGSHANQDGGKAPHVELTSTASTEKAEKEPKQKQCHACQSFSQQHHGFVSTDPATGLHYVTSQEPYTAALYGTVRSACLRSLSSEGCPGREGPVLFGSDQQGYVFSLTFYLKDSEARGRTRLCSIVVCSQDKLLLSSSWLYLVDCCSAIAEEMRVKAVSVFERDQQDGPKNAFPHMQSTNKGYKRPEQVRSISELCNQPQLYFQLHQSFSWMLSGLFTRVQTVPLTSKKAVVQKKESFDDDLDEDDETSGGARRGSLSQSAHPFTTDGGVGDGPCFSSLKHIHRLLGAGNFHLIANHVVRGSQIIIRSDCQATNASTLAILATLLPAGCCLATANSPHYLDSYRCNLLGMSLESALPQHLSGSEVFVLLDIVPPGKVNERTRSMVSGYAIPCDVEADPFQGYHFVLCCGGSGRDNHRSAGPLLLQRLTAIVGDQYLDDKATSECLSALKEEWMSKVHIAYRFSRRASEDATADRPRLLQVLQVGPEELPVLQFWLRALDSDQRSVLLRL